MIRYNIGDKCKVNSINFCKDGFPTYSITEILGRDEETLVLDNGKRVSRFSLSLKLLPEKVLSSQLFFYRREKKAVLNYLSKDVIKDKEFEEFSNHLLERIGTDYVIKFNHVIKLSKEKSGKVRTVFII